MLVLIETLTSLWQIKHGNIIVMASATERCFFQESAANDWVLFSLCSSMDEPVSGTEEQEEHKK